MSLRDPVAVYNAANNIEAGVIRLALHAAGIEAFVTEDLSTAGLWMFGLLPVIHNPQVWIERDDIQRAKPVLDEYESHEAQRRKADAAKLSDEPPIQAVCEECGRSASFPAIQRGTVQQCPHCRVYIDVDDPDAIDDSQWQADEDVDEE